MFFILVLHQKNLNIMFGYQFPTWLPILFFVVLLVSSFFVGKWLLKNDRKYKS